MARAGDLLRQLAELESNCDRHTFPLTVWLDPTAKPSRQTNIIGGCLRVLAQDTDGLCSIRGVKDRHLISSSGATFRFTSAEKRKQFRDRIPMYLSSSVKERLTLADG